LQHTTLKRFVTALVFATATAPTVVVGDGQNARWCGLG